MKMKILACLFLFCLLHFHNELLGQGGEIVNGIRIFVRQFSRNSELLIEEANSSKVVFEQIISIDGGKKIQGYLNNRGNSNFKNYSEWETRLNELRIRETWNRLDEKNLKAIQEARSL